MRADVAQPGGATLVRSRAMPVLSRDVVAAIAVVLIASIGGCEPDGRRRGGDDDDADDTVSASSGSGGAGGVSQGPGPSSTGVGGNCSPPGTPCQLASECCDESCVN